MKTTHLSGLQFRGLQNLGDAFIPGDREFPSFSKLGCAEHADRMLEEMPEGDRGDLKTLLLLLAFMPVFIIRGLLKFLELSPKIPGGLGAMLRLMRFGMKGVVISLYYSGFAGANYKGSSPLKLLKYEVSVYTADLDGASTASSAKNEAAGSPSLGNR